MPQRKIYTADFETDPFEHGIYPKPFWGGLYDGKRHIDKWSTNCAEWLTDILCDTDGIIYFHNGGKFDFHFIIPHLPDEVEIFMIGSRLVSLKFGKCELRDSYAILPIALAKMGDKYEIDYDKFKEENREENKNEIIRYARQDNAVLYDLVSDFIREYGNSLTLAGAAFKQLKKVGINPPKGNEAQDSKLREYYYGGRVQCFEYGSIEPPKGETLKYIDINSAYPYAMLSKHSFDQSFYESELPSDDAEFFNGGFYTIDATSKGALPMRTKEGISFPVGRNIYKATGWEIRAGLDTDTLEIHSYIKCLTPNSMISFEEYVNKFYAMKKRADANGDQNLRTFSKLMLNSAYGKFAIDPRRFKDYILHDIAEGRPKDENGLPIPNCVHKADIDNSDFAIWAHEIEKDKLSAAFKNVATAASITGFVRAYLWRAICKVENPLYCDTDSIICSGTSDLEISKELGGWDLEAEALRVHIAGKKLYAMELPNNKSKIASKGVRASLADIKRACKGETVNLKNDAPTFSLLRSTTFISRNIKKTIDPNSPNPFSPFIA